MGGTVTDDLMTQLTNSVERKKKDFQSFQQKSYPTAIRSK